jgi:hypothetical protein
MRASSSHTHHAGEGLLPDSASGFVTNSKNVVASRRGYRWSICARSAAVIDSSNSFVVAKQTLVNLVDESEQSVRCCTCQHCIPLSTAAQNLGEIVFALK